ncbi:MULTISPECIES: hypothetical protein [Bremerella]|uniref:hypothetical protein n=1 Tax=Bremerella TaxID=2714594 RepID=UPI0031EDB6D8
MSESEAIQDAELPAASSEEMAEIPPTYAPAAMALGVTMLLWGITTMWIMSAAGFAVMVYALWSWIIEISHDWKKESTGE